MTRDVAKKDTAAGAALRAPFVEEFHQRAQEDGGRGRCNRRWRIGEFDGKVHLIDGTHRAIAYLACMERGVSAEFLRTDALTLTELDRRFDSVIDSGLFHVFSDEDRARYVAGLAHVTGPGGRLFLLCFSDAEPGTEGPRRVSKRELEEAFADGWQIESIQPSRFETRPDLKEFTFSPGGPKTWFLIARRT